MSRDPMRNYDAWLEEPYQRACDEAEAERCPRCDSIFDCDCYAPDPDAGRDDPGPERDERP